MSTRPTPSLSNWVNGSLCVGSFLDLDSSPEDCRQVPRQVETKINKDKVGYYGPLP